MVATPLEAWHGCLLGCKKELQIWNSVKSITVIASVIAVASIAVMPPPSRVVAGLTASDSRQNPLPNEATGWSQHPIGKKVISVDVPCGVLPLRSGRFAASDCTAQKVRMKVTAYCPCSRCCGINACGVTASGHTVHINGGRFVAADPQIAFGTCVSIPGYHQGEPVPVIDRGSMIKGARVDVFFPTHKQARQWGIRWLDVLVYSPGNPVAADSSGEGALASGAVSAPG